MPKALEEQLRREVEHRAWSQARKDAYVYGTLRKTGWKPEREKGNGKGNDRPEAE